MKALRLSTVDVLNVAFLAALVAVYVPIRSRTPYAALPTLLYASLLVLFLVFRRFRASKPAMLIYPILFNIGAFASLFMTVPYAGEPIDSLLSRIDRAVLGVDVTVWLQAWTVPWLTEVMYLLYAAYFPLPLVLLLRMYRRKDWVTLEESMVTLLTCFYAGYLLYYCVPALGPRGFMAQAHTVPLEGLLLSAPIEATLTTLEKNRYDAFPSLHAAVTFATVLLAYRFDARLFRVLLPIALGIFISLVYLRHHYVVDAVAGILLAAGCATLWSLCFSRIRRKLHPHFLSEVRSRRKGAGMTSVDGWMKSVAQGP